MRRVELLRLRFEEDLAHPVDRRALGRRGGRVASRYALARKEFRAALLEVVAFHHPGIRPRWNGRQRNC